MKRTTILILQYYRILLVYNLTFTGACILIAYFMFHELNAPIVFFAKIFRFLSAAALNDYMARQSYFYFRNAGFRMRRIMISAFLADTFSFILVYLLFILVTNAAAYFKG